MAVSSAGWDPSQSVFSWMGAFTEWIQLDGSRHRVYSAGWEPSQSGFSWTGAFTEWIQLDGSRHRVDSAGWEPSQSQNISIYLKIFSIYLHGHISKHRSTRDRVNKSNTQCSDEQCGQITKILHD